MKANTPMILALVLASGIFFGCGESDQQGGTSIKGDVNAGRPLASDAAQPTGSSGAAAGDAGALLTIYRSQTSGARVAEPTLVAIRTQRQLERLLRRERRANPHQPRPRVSIDFDRGRQGWALFMPRGTHGSFVAINRVQQSGDSILVRATYVTPAKQCDAGAGSPRSTAWVETATMTGAARLKLTRVKQRCQ